MNNPSVFHEPKESKLRNDNAEWAALKEVAAIGVRCFSLDVEPQLDPQERAKYRRRGEWLLKIVNQMPERPVVEEKTKTLDRVYNVAEKAGVVGDLQRAMEDRIHPKYIGEIGDQTFEGGKKDLSLEEERNLEELRGKVFDLASSAPGELAGQFPSGNFLYHGSTVERIEKIFQSGGLKNGIALVEDSPEIGAADLNSGYEGVSWSMNDIDALPGTRDHIAGFVAAPEDVLSSNEQLVVPSRPAPYEVLQMDAKIDAGELYQLKNQLETWGDGSVSLGEKNNVDSNLMRMLMYKEGDDFFGDSMVYGYDGDLSAEHLRNYYSLDSGGDLTWDADIYQKFEVPPALPWIQSLIDRDVFAKNDYKDLDSVRKVLDYAKNDKDFVKGLIATERSVAEPIRDRYDRLLEDVDPVRVDVGKMYFVTSHKDLESWLKVMVRNRVEPKGILLYDDERVIMENFASDYEGNHKELGAEISNAVGVDRDFWIDKMGFDPEELPRSGNKGQVLLESAVKRDKSIRMIDDELAVV